MKAHIEPPGRNRVLVWDLPTRLFHWLLALSFAGAFLTADSERQRDIHVLLGYTFAGLIAFRLAWGIAGTRYARFRSFGFAPREIGRYLGSLLSGAPRRYLGHNPAGSVAIFLLLGLGAAIAASGITMFNGIDGDGLEELHEGAANAMLAVVFVHVAGVLVSSVLHRENLIRSMITGRKLGEPGEGIRSSRAWLGALLLAAVLAFWYGYPRWTAVEPSAEAAAPTSVSALDETAHR
jgi:cytochrome b